MGDLERRLTTDAAYLQQSLEKYEQLPAKNPYTLGYGNTAAYLPLQSITPPLQSQMLPIGRIAFQ